MGISAVGQGQSASEAMSVEKKQSIVSFEGIQQASGPKKDEAIISERAKDLAAAVNAPQYTQNGVATAAQQNTQDVVAAAAQQNTMDAAAMAAMRYRQAQGIF